MGIKFVLREQEREGERERELGRAAAEKKSNAPPKGQRRRQIERKPYLFSEALKLCVKSCKHGTNVCS
jgi:hypothetical protein